MTKTMLDAESLSALGTNLLNSVDISTAKNAVDDLEKITDFCVKMIVFLIIKSCNSKEHAFSVAENISQHLMNLIDEKYDAITEAGVKQ